MFSLVKETASQFTYRDPEDQAGHFLHVVQHDHNYQQAGGTKKLKQPKDQLNIPHPYDPSFGPRAHGPETLDGALCRGIGTGSIAVHCQSPSSKYFMIDNHHLPCSGDHVFFSYILWMDIE